VLAVTIPERPGSFRELCGLLGRRSVTEFNYRWTPGAEAHVFLGVSSSGREETQRLVRSLARHGIAAEDLSDNELAKLHVRHLVGGRTPAAGAEMLYRFEFPERPGALVQFLHGMGSDWNITLFHYRNHGADVGRVLVGLQVPARERPAFRNFLRRLGYEYADESRNPAYRLFLK
jgi:threonine dehydratase